MSNRPHLGSEPRPGCTLFAPRTAEAAAAKKKSKAAGKKKSSKKPTKARKKSTKKKAKASKRSKTATVKKTAKKAAKKTAKKATAKKAAKKATAKKAANKVAKKVATTATTKKTTTTAVGGSDRKVVRNSRLIQKIRAMPPIEQEAYFENIPRDELIRLFDRSFPSDLASVLAGLKQQTCRDLFEAIIRHRRKAYVDTITLFYYQDYLSDPLPLVVQTTRRNLRLPNYYALLGVSREAADEEIHEAARLLLKAFQPESFPPADRALAESRREEIREAYNKLRGEEHRHEADALLPSVHSLYPRRDRTWLSRLKRLFP